MNSLLNHVGGVINTTVAVTEATDCSIERNRNMESAMHSIPDSMWKEGSEAYYLKIFEMKILLTADGILEKRK